MEDGMLVLQLNVNLCFFSSFKSSRLKRKQIQYKHSNASTFYASWRVRCGPNCSGQSSILGCLCPLQEHHRMLSNAWLLLGSTKCIYTWSLFTHKNLQNTLCCDDGFEKRFHDHLMFQNPKAKQQRHFEYKALLGHVLSKRWSSFDFSISLRCGSFVRQTLWSSPNKCKWLHRWH